MKKINLIILFFVILFSTKLHAQSFGVGVKSGLNVSTLITDDEELEDWGTLPGGHIGGYGYYMFSGNAGIEAGVMFTQAGFWIEHGNDYYDEYKLNYFAIPLSARFKWGYFTLNPGVQFSFLMSANNKDGDDLSEGLTSTDVGLTVTPGIELPIGLNFGTTFNIGLTNLIEDSNFTYSNFVFQFSVGYTFLKK